MGKVTLPKGFEPDPVKHWYLVANRADAQIYEGMLNGGFHFLRRYRNPRARLHAQDLAEDKRAFTDSRARHGYEPGAAAREAAAARFARRIAASLDRASSRHEFTDLVIVAEPQFLGLMNKELSKQVRRQVRREVARDWAHQGSDDELKEFLRGKLV